LHTNDSVGSPIRLIDMGAPAYMVAMSLQVVIAQRLLRMICESCVESYSPSSQEQAWLAHYGKSASTAGLHKGSGCTRCNGTGYRGRAGVYEMLEMTDPLVAAANEANPAKFVTTGRKQIEGESLIDHAIDLVLAGKTTIDEAMRISEQIED
jgi:MSHA biogenesis protein MshE